MQSAATAHRQDDELETVLEWGRLASLPESASGFQISAEGSMFTRAFRSSFRLPEDELDAWIAASPGLQHAQAEALGDGSQRYVIDPGGGAQYAEAIIHFEHGQVEIYAYWS